MVQLFHTTKSDQITSSLTVIGVLLVGFILTFMVIATYQAAEKGEPVEVISIAPPLISVMLAAVAIVSMNLNKYNTDRDNKKQQLEKLYIPLRMLLTGSKEVELSEIERYSYLATGELAPLIDNYIEQRNKYLKLANSSPSDERVLEAVYMI